MAIASRMQPMYKRLKRAGFPEKYVREKVLPDWWDDHIAETPAGYGQAVTMIALNLNIDPCSLEDEQSEIVCTKFGKPKYKKQAGHTDGELEPATCIAVRAAKIACLGVDIGAAPVPVSAQEIRRSLLARGSQCVHFEALLDYCWSLGIPVLHVSEFPSGKKPDALSATMDGRPAIVLCKKIQYSAWLLFHLAHELGHIALGHLEGAGVLIDEEVKSDTDEEETEANRFAIELLTGQSERHINFGDLITSSSLASKVVAVGQYNTIDAGFLALLHGRATGNWGTVNGALKFIEEKPRAIEAVRSRMLAHVDEERLSSESYGFLLRIT
ncbi:MAG TPA: ImmA/IrrE family metallo-endopeptidase, partial [Chthonomonadaceae bacterium]|nr:ImmA/IrrE family metallo-endopeptidase [Chthonomonadaceae bacterium]